MTELEVVDTLYSRCDAAVTQLMERYGWRLLDREEFVRRVVVSISGGEFSEPWPAAMNVYCWCLYSACFGHDGPGQQERAFAELYRYLHALSFRIVVDLPADIRDELVNEALTRVWQRLASYRKPGAFLAVTAMELRNVLRPCWKRRVLLLSIDTLAEQLPAHAYSDPVAESLNNDLRRQVQSCFAETYRSHPRAKKQLEAVWLKYLGYEDTAISELLGTPIKNVHVLRSRGLDLLREEPCWKLLAIDSISPTYTAAVGEDRKHL